MIRQQGCASPEIPNELVKFTLRPIFQVRIAFPGAGPRPPLGGLPCDALGHVDLNALDERERDNYLFVRACIGRDYDNPKVEPSDMH